MLTTPVRDQPHDRVDVVMPGLGGSVGDEPATQDAGGDGGGGVEDGDGQFIGNVAEVPLGQFVEKVLSLIHI